ncbi:MAG: response regulator [Elusimicrobia bacterium]|nr:response regulator [Elusimicrobiota bacterium]
MLHKALSVEHISKICHVTSTTVLRWIQHHNLKTVNLSGTEPLVWRQDLIAFLQAIHVPVPRELVVSDTIRIVVAVSDTTIRDQVRQELEDLFPGSKIPIAHNAFEAGLFTFEYNPHIMVVDLAMQGIDTERIGTILKNSDRFKFIKIIGLASPEQEAQKQTLLTKGIDIVFPKPFAVKEFKDQIVFLANELLK